MVTAGAGGAAAGSFVLFLVVSVEGVFFATAARGSLSAKVTCVFKLVEDMLGILGGPKKN